MKLVVTVPAQNEEPTIGRVVRGIPRDIPGVSRVEVIVLDDSSTDATADEARHAGASVIHVEGRPGLGRVFQAGVDEAMRRGADLLVNIDGDGQFASADVATLVRPLVEGRADFVTCTRFADPSMRPTMPALKFWGNWAVVRIVNFACGGRGRFTDVSCGFRGFNRQSLYRLTLFGRYTYTQECFIDLFAKNVRIVEVPLRVRGVREHGKSRVAKSVWKYGINTLPIIVRAMRDIRPLKFFGVLALLLSLPGFTLLGVVFWNYTLANPGKTQPYTSAITLGTAFLTLSVIVGVMALLADMMARHRRISEELLYLARERVYGTNAHSAAVSPDVGVPHAAHLARHGVNGSNGTAAVATNGERRKLPVLREAAMIP